MGIRKGRNAVKLGMGKEVKKEGRKEWYLFGKGKTKLERGKN